MAEGGGWEGWKELRAKWDPREYHTGSGLEEYLRVGDTELTVGCGFSDAPNMFKRGPPWRRELGRLNSGCSRSSCLGQQRWALIRAQRLPLPSWV